MDTQTPTTTVTTTVVKPEAFTEVVQADDKAPKQPSFGISEGTRNDLELYGKATDPFTGKLLTGNSKSSPKPASK